MDAPLKTRLRLLTSQREALEIEADAIHSELTSRGPNGEPPAGVKGSLVDSEGYPRADIDVHNVKIKRHRLAVVNFDYNEIMKQIENLLHEINSSEMQQQPQNNANVTVNSSYGVGSDKVMSESKASDRSSHVFSMLSAVPICKIDEILPDSPAASAGLVDEDELLMFGRLYVNPNEPDAQSAALNAISEIPSVVKEGINREIPLVVRRGGIDVLELKVIPRSWSGRGLLGCHLSPK